MPMCFAIFFNSLKFILSFPIPDFRQLGSISQALILSNSIFRAVLLEQVGPNTAYSESQKGRPSHSPFPISDIKTFGFLTFPAANCRCHMLFWVHFA